MQELKDNCGTVLEEGQKVAYNTDAGIVLGKIVKIYFLPSQYVAGHKQARIQVEQEAPKKGKISKLWFGCNVLVIKDGISN
jgi:hypothetical protein